MPDPADAARSIYEDLAVVTSDELVAMWDALGSYNRPDIKRMAATARPLITATATTASRTQVALHRTLTGVTLEPDPLIPARILQRLEQPFTASWHALSQHRPWDEAIDVGRSATEAYGRDVAYQSARQTMTLATNGKFTRSISGTACEWCQQFEGVEFATADAATFGHQRCDCIVVPAL